MYVWSYIWLESLWRLTYRTIRPLCILCGKILNDWLNFFNGYRTLPIFFAFLRQFWEFLFVLDTCLCAFSELLPFTCRRRWNATPCGMRSGFLCGCWWLGDVVWKFRVSSCGVNLEKWGMGEKRESGILIPLSFALSLHCSKVYFLLSAFLQQFHETSKHTCWDLLCFFLPQCDVVASVSHHIASLLLPSLPPFPQPHQPGLIQ